MFGESVGLGSGVLLDDGSELSVGELLVLNSLGKVIDGGDGSSDAGLVDGSLGLLSESTDFGESG